MTHEAQPLSHVLASLETGKRPHGGAIDSGVPSLGGEHVNANGTLKLDPMKYVPEKFFVGLKKGLIRSDDILVVKDGATTGRVGFVDTAFPHKRAAINEHLFLLRADRNKVEPLYLYYLLRSPIGNAQIMSDFRGAAQGGISRGFADKVNVPVCTLDEQRRIVDLLSRAEGIVCLRRDAEKKAAELIPALFLDMFGDPGTNPKGWATTSIGEIATYTRYGPRFPDRQYSDNGAHILRTTDMGYNGELRWFNSPILPMSDEEIEKYSLHRGTLLITRTGATIGKTALFKGASRPCIAGAYLIEVGLSSAVRPEFVLHFFLSRFGQAQLAGGSRAAAQPNINAPTIRAIPIQLPNIEVQEVFAGRVAEIESIQSQQSTATDKAQAVFDALLARAFHRTESIA